MKHFTSFLFIFILFYSFDGKAQDVSRLYLNAGYVTNLQKCDECTKADAGGSIRLGILTKGRMGYYAGYVWFKEFHPAYIEYDDEGTLFLAGIDYLLLRKEGFRLYAKAGLGVEKFKSTYPNRTETETSVKPEFGMLLSIYDFNFYLGWQPSDPPHINIGIGFSFPIDSQGSQGD